MLRMDFHDLYQITPLAETRMFWGKDGAFVSLYIQDEELNSK